MKIDHRIDDRAKRVVVILGRGETGANATQFIRDLVEQRPELTGWDWIHDVRESAADAGHADASLVAEAFAGSPPGQTYTVFVTNDRNLILWCRVMDHQFRDRLHLTALTLEAAHAELDARRGRTASPARGSG